MAPPAYQLAHCVVCGHAEADVVADADGVRAEIEELWAFHARRLRAGIPPRRLLDRVAFSEHPALQIVRCRECGLVYRNPVERATELTEIYARGDLSPDLLRALHRTQLAAVRTQAKRLRRAIGRGGSALEVGSYVGAFLHAARDEGLTVEGVDVNTTVNAFVRSLGFTVHDGDLIAFDRARRFDAIAIWNTFDQLAEPRASLAVAAELLSPGGVLVLRVPNGAAYASLRRRLFGGSAVVRRAARAVLAFNNLLGFPYRAGFSPESLGRLLGEMGFEVFDVRGDVLVPTADEWTRRWARVEERIFKRLLGAAARGWPERAPWVEVYARRARPPKG